jgi:hypothetical protein
MISVSLGIHLGEDEQGCYYWAIAVLCVNRLVGSIKYMRTDCNESASCQETELENELNRIERSFKNAHLNRQNTVVNNDPMPQMASVAPYVLVRQRIQCRIPSRKGCQPSPATPSKDLLIIIRPNTLQMTFHRIIIPTHCHSLAPSSLL